MPAIWGFDQWLQVKRILSDNTYMEMYPIIRGSTHLRSHRHKHHSLVAVDVGVNDGVKEAVGVVEGVGVVEAVGVAVDVR